MTIFWKKNYNEDLYIALQALQAVQSEHHKNPKAKSSFKNVSAKLEVAFCRLSVAWSPVTFVLNGHCIIHVCPNFMEFAIYLEEIYEEAYCVAFDEGCLMDIFMLHTKSALCLPSKIQPHLVKTSNLDITDVYVSSDIIIYTGSRKKYFVVSLILIGVVFLEHIIY